WRLVIRPATCGSRARSANAAPPLKSTSTNASWSGGWVAARPATIVRSSSLLPDPVAPTTRPWGPIPASAASLRSRTTGFPSGVTPIGTRRSSARSRGRGTGPAEAGPGPRRSRGASRRTRPAAGGGAAVEPERRHPPGQGLAEARVGRVGSDAGDKAPARSGLLEHGRASTVHADARGELGRLAGDRSGKPDDRCPGRAGILEKPA